MLAAALTLGVAPGLRADMIYDQPNNWSGAGARVADSSNNDFVGAQSIDTGLGDEITDVTVSLYINGSYGATNQWYLYTDNAGTPGSEVALLGTLNDSEITPGVSNIYYDLGADDIAVSQNTTYWVVDQFDAAASSGTQEIEWDATGNLTGTTGVSDQTALRASGSGWSNYNPSSFQMVVSGDDGPNPTPEPASIGFLGLGLCGLGLIRRRKPRVQG